MTITAQLADGTTLEFPDGTDPAVIQRVVKSQMQGGQPAQVPAGPSQSAGAAFAGNLLPGMTFGFADEVAAGIGSLFEDRSYDEILAGLRAQQTKQREEHPGAAYGGEIVGGALSGGAAGGAVVGTGKTLAGKAALGGLTGSVEGGLTGFGNAEGGIAQRGKGAARGAALGGVTGTAAPVALAGIAAGGRALANPVASALNIPSQTRAGNAFQTYLGRAGMTADDVAAATQRAAAEGQPQFMAADALGNSGQRALSGVARQPGDARQIIADMLMQRQDGQAGRLGGFVDDALNLPQNLPVLPAQAMGNVGKTADQVTDGLMSARGTAANAAYDAARTGAGPVDVRGALQTIDDRLGPMAGSNVAGDGIDGTLAKFRGRLAANTPPAGMTGVELSDFDRVLGVKQDLQDAIGAAVRAGRNNEARELGKLQAALDSALEGASGGYRAANDGFRTASRVIEQVDAGKAATSPRMRAENTVPAYQGLSPDGQSAFRAGYADPTIARIDSAAPGVNKARPLRNDKVSAELGAMAADPALLQRQIGRENTMFETGAAALGGSKTADNLADMGDTSALSASMIGNLLSGRFGAAGGQALDRLMSGATGSNPATREIIAKMLMSQDPRALLAPAQRSAQTGGRVNDAISALIRSGQRTLGQ